MVVLIYVVEYVMMSFFLMFVISMFGDVWMECKVVLKEFVKFEF